MNKLVALGAGALAIPAAIGASALFSTPVASSEPGNYQAMNVVGEPYARAMAILRSQGVRGAFGGSVGSDVPQAQCIVTQQKITRSGRMILNLDCTTKAVQDAGAGGGSLPIGAPSGPNVGANGVTTVQATPVGPPPAPPPG